MNSSDHVLTRKANELTEYRSKPPVRRQAVGGTESARTLASYLEIPFLHKRLIIGCTLAGMLLGWLAILVWPRTYQSEAKLMIRVGRESVSLDPTATTSSTLLLQKTREEEIVSAQEVLNSRQVADAVVEKIGADAILNGSLPSADGESTRGGLIDTLRSAAGDSLYWILTTAGIKDDISNRELAVRKLQGSVDIRSPRKSTVIVIDGSAKTPEMAQAIVDEVTKAFMAEHLEAAQTLGSHEFFVQQSGEVEKQLNDLVARRSEYMQERKIVSIAANRELLQNQFTGIDRDLVLASGELEQAISEIADLKSKVADAKDEIVASKSGLTWSGMRQRIYNLELDELKLASSLPPEHPKLNAIRNELSGARKILDALKEGGMDESTTPSPTKMRLREDLQKQQTRVAGLRSIIEQKNSQRAELENQSNELLEYDRALTRIDRDIALKESSLHSLREKLEEARVIDELQSDKISNVHTYQPATFAERAVSPKKPVLAMGFSLLGLMTGLGISLFRETASPFLRTAQDVEVKLGTSVISTIPYLPQTRTLKLREQDLYRQQIQALVGDILLSPGRPLENCGRSIAVLGVDTDAGASSLAANLAVTSGDEGRMKTILVDADSRRHTVSDLFGLDGMPGLVELVNGIASYDECLQQAQNAPIHLIASAADSCPEILTTSVPEIVQALQSYKYDCDLMIVDLPAASQPDQAIALAQQFDSVLVVVESGKSRTESVRRLLRRLSEGNTEVLGVVLSKTRSHLPKPLQQFFAPQ